MKRDTSKPEQQTPAEWIANWHPESVSDALGNPEWIKDNRDKWVELFALANNGTYDTDRRLRVNPNGTYTVQTKQGRRWVAIYADSPDLRELMFRGGMPETLTQAELLRVRAASEGKPLFQSRHKGDISRAISNDESVSAESVEAYGIDLPEGYAKDGELYVFAQ